MRTPHFVDAPWPAGEAFAAYHVVYASTRSPDGFYPTPTNADIHQGFEVGMLLKGRQLRTFPDLSLEAGPGDAWLIPPWEPHGWETTVPGTHEVVIHFVPGFLGDEQFAGVSWLALFSASPDKRPRVRGVDTRRKVLAIASELAWDLESKPVAWVDSMRLNLLRLLLMLRQAWDDTASATSPRRSEMKELARLMPAIRLVHSNPARRVSLTDAAQECCVSTELFRALFRQVMGLSFGKFALRARLAHAAGLLRDTDLTMGTISEESGFADASHFHRMFVKVYGRAPGRYRDDIQAQDAYETRIASHASDTTGKKMMVDGRQGSYPVEEEGRVRPHRR